MLSDRLQRSLLSHETMLPRKVSWWKGEMSQSMARDVLKSSGSRKGDFIVYMNEVCVCVCGVVG